MWNNEGVFHLQGIIIHLIIMSLYNPSYYPFQLDSKKEKVEKNLTLKTLNVKTILKRNVPEVLDKII